MPSGTIVRALQAGIYEAMQKGLGLTALSARKGHDPSDHERLFRAERRNGIDVYSVVPTTMVWICQPDETLCMVGTTRGPTSVMVVISTPPTPDMKARGFPTV